MINQVYRISEGLFDPERGFKGGRREGLEFIVEHYPWKRLPAEVFTSLGGKESAKSLRMQNKKDDSDKSEKTNTTSSTITATQLNTQTLNENPSVASTTIAEVKKISLQNVDLKISNTEESMKKRLWSEMSQNELRSNTKLADRDSALVPKLFPRKKVTRNFVTPVLIWTNLQSS